MADREAGMRAKAEQGMKNAEQKVKKMRKPKRKPELMFPSWYVGKVGDHESVAFDTEAEAKAAIAGISIADPKGCEEGMYYIDPPSDGEEGPGELAIYSSELMARGL